MKTNFSDLLCRFFRNRLQTALLLLLTCFVQGAYAQDPAQYGTPYAGVPNPLDVNLYQVNIRPFSTGSNLPGVTARLDQIKAVGTNVIYLMPVYPVGTDSKSKLASSTSPYSIKDFTSVGAEYGTLSDLRALVDGAHSRGMAVILDFAVNGTSWDHPWTIQHPDWYNRDGSGNIQQLASFPDVAGLNFSNTSMRTAMINAMRYWVFAANVDGFRCDFANNPPLDFWTQAITSLRGITSHKLLMFAEGDRRENFQTGFDYTFGDQFYYVALKPIHNGTSVSQIQATTDYEYTYANANQQVIRYTGNHDTSADGTPLEIFGGTTGVMANFVVSAYMRGVPFLYGGQEVAFAQRIPWPYDSINIDWTLNSSVTAEFAKVLNFRTSSTAIRRGTMTNYSDANVCAFTKVSGTEKVVVLVNLRGSSSAYTIPAALAGTYKDAYSNNAVTLTSGAPTTLTAYQYIVLTNQGTGTSVAVSSVSVSPSTVTLAINATQQLTPTVLPANATNKTVTYTSGNTAVATVSSTGLVTAKTSGTATITVTTQDGNKTATAAVTVTGTGSGSVTYYQIQNRWQASSYLYDAGNGKVVYGTGPVTANYQWARIDAGGGYFLLKNRATGNLMHVENQNGNVQSTTGDPTWYSAMWSIPAATDGWSNIQNRWQTSEMIHIEGLTGSAQYSGAQAGWYSAMWKFVNPVTGP
jgi:glycosidase